MCTDAASVPRLRGVLAGFELTLVARGAGDDDVVELDAGLAAQDDELTPADTHCDDMAFWLYSSGSTGKPKGVVHPHHDIECRASRSPGTCLACARTT